MIYLIHQTAYRPPRKKMEQVESWALQHEMIYLLFATIITNTYIHKYNFSTDQKFSPTTTHKVENDDGDHH